MKKIALAVFSIVPLQLAHVPDNLQAPAGNHAFLEGHAVGTQNYMCLPSGSLVAWTATARPAPLSSSGLRFRSSEREAFSTAFAPTAAPKAKETQIRKRLIDV